MINRIEGFLKKNNFVSFMDRNYFRKGYYQTVEKVFSELKHIESLSEDEIKELQDKRMLILLRYAYENCRYYKRLFDEHDININSLDHLVNIPILTKEIIREHGRAMISRSKKKIFLARRNTGGSTGEPLEFYSDMNACAIDLAHHKYLYHLMGYESGDLVAGGTGITIPKSYRDKNIYWVRRSKYSIWWQLCYSALYLNRETIKFYIKHFLEVKPAILRGYPSFWDAIAVYILENNIDIDFNVKAVNLSAEICLDEQRERIERAFKSKVYLEYGQSELTILCYEDGTSRMYQTAPLYGYVEVVKDNGEYAKPGEEGEVIATSLCNYGMPFIRYRTGDRVMVSRCKGGMVWFDRFEGRTQDYIIDKNNQKVALTALIFGQHLQAFKNITQWQLEQDRIGHVNVNIVKGPGYTEQDEKEINHKIKVSASTPVDLTFQYKDRIPLNKNGKFAFLVRNGE